MKKIAGLPQNELFMSSDRNNDIRQIRETGEYDRQSANFLFEKALYYGNFGNYHRLPKYGKSQGLLGEIAFGITKCVSRRYGVTNPNKNMTSDLSRKIS